MNPPEADLVGVEETQVGPERPQQIGPKSPRKREEQSALVQRPQQPRVADTQFGPESPRELKEHDALVQRPQQPRATVEAQLGRPADVKPPEADLVGVEAVESQVAEDESLDRARSHAHSSLNREESPPDPPVSRTTPDGGYRSKYGSLSMPKGPTPFRRSQRLPVVPPPRMAGAGGRV